MALTPVALDSESPQVLHPRLAELGFIRCQTSLNSLIYGANFGNYERVTDSGGMGEWWWPPSSVSSAGREGLIDTGLFGGEFFGVQTELHELVGPGEQSGRNIKRRQDHQDFLRKPDYSSHKQRNQQHIQVRFTTSQVQLGQGGISDGTDHEEGKQIDDCH